MVSGMISQDFSATALFLNADSSRLFPAETIPDTIYSSHKQLLGGIPW
jgi:hypothetical protein